MSSSPCSQDDIILQGHEKRWVLRHVSEDRAEKLSAFLKCSPLTARVLLSRGIDGDSAAHFLYGHVERFVADQEDLDHARVRIERAVADHEKIFIHGDYDVDGITSAVILRCALEILGAQTEVFLPHRIRDGYGVSERGVMRALESGAKLFLTADCGSSSDDVFDRLKNAGCDAIVTDHHVQEAPLRHAVAVLNPVKPGSRWLDRDLAAAGVAYLLALYLLETAGERATPLIHAMAAIGTVADVAPLRGENRQIVRRGLQALRECDNPGLLGLIQKARIDPNHVRASNIAYQIGPRLNAAGRLDDATKAFELFFEKDPGRLFSSLDEIEQLNRRRQEIEEGILTAASDLVDPASPAIVLDGEGWDRGVIGIVASRLVERFHRPVLMMSRQGGMAFGSARSVPGVNIVECLRSCREILATFGGHELAAGFTLPEDQISLFRNRLEITISELNMAFIPELHVDATVDPSQSLFEAIQDLAGLEPFGRGNPEPLFLFRSVRLLHAPRILGRKGVRFQVRAGERNFTGVAWRKPDWQIPVGLPIDIVARLQIHEHQGLKEVQFQVEDFRNGV